MKKQYNKHIFDLNWRRHNRPRKDRQHSFIHNRDVDVHYRSQTKSKYLDVAENQSKENPLILFKHHIIVNKIAIDRDYSNGYKKVSLTDKMQQELNNRSMR